MRARCCWTGRICAPLRGPGAGRSAGASRWCSRTRAKSINPRLTIGDIIAEPLRLQGGVGKAEERRRVAALLGRVGLNPEMALRWPGTVSGGQAQRIAIARALAAAPEVIVLDEPTSALDVSTQAMLLNLLKDLARREALSYILISHDFAVVSYMADRIAVLNAGRIVEMNETAG